jgi:hypothetical protein
MQMNIQDMKKINNAMEGLDPSLLLQDASLMSLMDSAEGQIFFTKQLEYVFSKMYEVKYAEILYPVLFPVTKEVPFWANTTSYHVQDRAGRAKVLGTDVNDLPKVDISKKEVIHPVRPLGCAFSYNVFEVARAQQTGMSLQTERANAGRRFHEEALNSIMWDGDAEYNLPGLFSNASIPTSAAPNGAGGTPQWSTKTPEEILADINFMHNKINEDSKMVHKPNTLGVTPANRNYLFSTQKSAASDITIGQWLINNLDWISGPDAIIAANEFVGKGSGATDVAMAYQRDADIVQAVLAQDVTPWPAKQELLGWTVPLTSVTSGLHVRYPVAFYILDDV